MADTCLKVGGPKPHRLWALGWCLVLDQPEDDGRAVTRRSAHQGPALSRFVLTMARRILRTTAAFVSPMDFTRWRPKSAPAPGRRARIGDSNAEIDRFENHAAAILVLALTLSGVSYAILMQVLC
ncbi:hypothetical protein [Microvirga sp. VF16]|uniref:hypothetical protein n=1 Tax=Microvirga sp. VF16 TaxID=2807101 RepID=UPI00193CC11D|nr:hypothetical protein [Microvirga sp. VF16]QRM27632.1 hypothetical protein JO965_15250 [Microvirga sp. VF16]